MIPAAAPRRSVMPLSIIDMFYVLMAMPNLVAGVLLAPRVIAAARVYLARSSEQDERR